MSLVLPRIAAAFLLLPFFTPETIPSLLRNIFFVAVALAVMPLVLSDPPPPTLSGIELAPIVLKEVFIGVSLGFSFGMVFWALEGAGQVIDTKIGTAMAQLVDPMSGSSTTLIGAYLGRLGGYLFAALGGLHLFVDLVLSSFRVWPLMAPMPNLQEAGAMFFVGRFDELMRLILLLSAPVLCVLTLLEIGLGFVNRFAPQLNVFVLAMSLKAWVAILILLVTIGSVVSFIIDWLGNQRDLLRILPLGG